MATKGQIKRIKKNVAEGKPSNRPNPTFGIKGATGKNVGGKITSGAADYMDNNSQDTTPKLNMTGKPKMAVQHETKGGKAKASMATKVASGNKKPFNNGLSTEAKMRFALKKKIGC